MEMKLKAIIEVLVILLIGSWIFVLSDCDKRLRTEDNTYVNTESTVTKKEVLESGVKIRKVSLAETVSQNINIKRIDCVNPTQEDIELIGKMINLEELNLSYFTSEIDLSPLGSLTHLKKLSLVVAQDAETDTRPLASLQQLEDIYIEGRIDLVFLEELDNLKEVVLNRNSIEDLSTFQHMEKLEKLDIHCVDHADFQELGELKRLRSVNLYIYQSMENIEYLGNLSNLSSLYIESGVRSDKKTVNLKFLKNLVSLRNLSIKNIKLEGLETISELTSLENLTLSNVVSVESKLDLEPIGKLEYLEYLCLENMKLESLELLKALKHLEHLKISGTDIGKKTREELELYLFYVDIEVDGVQG